MSELQAEQGAQTLDVSRAEAKSRTLSRRADRADRLCRAGAAADADQQQVPARFRHPLRRLRPVCDLAQSAGRFHRPDLIRPRHVLRPRRLWFWPDDAEDRRLRAGRLRRDAADHAGGRDRHRRDLRAPEGNLFRLRHAGVPDADPFHHSFLGVPDRRRSGPARRHSAAGVLRHRPVEPSASLHLQLRAAGARAVADAPDRAVAVRLHLAHDPRQRHPRQLRRHRRLPRQAHDLRAGRAVCLRRRHDHGAVRLGRLSGVRLLDDLRRGHLHQHARRRHHVPRVRWSAPCCC